MEVRAETFLLALAAGRSLVILRIGDQSPNGVNPVENEKELGTVIMEFSYTQEQEHRRGVVTREGYGVKGDFFFFFF